MSGYSDIVDAIKKLNNRLGSLSVNDMSLRVEMSTSQVYSRLNPDGSTDYIIKIDGKEIVLATEPAP